MISQKGYCAIGHKVGDIIEIDHFGVKGDICINAIFTMLPVAYAMMHNSYFPWLKDQCRELHACPDRCPKLVQSWTSMSLTDVRFLIH